MNTPLVTAFGSVLGLSAGVDKLGSRNAMMTDHDAAKGARVRSAEPIVVGAVDREELNRLVRGIRRRSSWRYTPGSSCWRPRGSAIGRVLAGWGLRFRQSGAGNGVGTTSPT